MKAAIAGDDEIDAQPESDRATHCLHPRENFALSSHMDAELRLAQAMRGGHMAHAWLIEGPRGIGKATLAYRAARLWLGAKPAEANLKRAGRSSAEIGSDPATLRPLAVALDDPIARRLANLAHPDFTVIRRLYDPDRKKLRAEIRAEDARALSHFFALTSAMGGGRVAILDAVDDLNPQSANAILKILEEPPKGGVIFLIHHGERPLLPTIKSRCRSLRLRPLSDTQVASAVQAAAEPRLTAALEPEIVAGLEGRPGRYFAVEPEKGAALHRLASAIANGNSESASQFVAILGQGGAIFELGCDLVLAHLCRRCKAKTAQDWDTGQAHHEAWSRILQMKTETIDLDMDPALSARLISQLCLDLVRA